MLRKRFKNVKMCTHGFHEYSLRSTCFDCDRYAGYTEVSYGQFWIDPAYAPGSGGISYTKPQSTHDNSPLPHSVVMMLACYSAYFNDGANGGSPITLKEAFFSGEERSLHAAIFYGLKNEESAWSVNQFLPDYSDKVTDGHKTYKWAFKHAASQVYYSTWNYRYWYWDNGCYDHPTRKDRYRNIARRIDDIGTELWFHGYDHLHYTKSEVSGNPATVGQTNGAYYVWHGVVNSDEQDLTQYADIKIEIYAKYYEGDSFHLISSDEFFNVKNQMRGDATGTYYGGSDICSVNIPADIMAEIYQIRAKTIFMDGDAQKITIDRSEVIEIGT